MPQIRLLSMTAHNPDDESWRLQAACRNHPNPELWFPQFEDRKTCNEEAKQICRSCPVRDQCLAFAMNNPNISGIWGATTTRERAKVRRAAGTHCINGHPARHFTIGSNGSPRCRECERQRLERTRDKRRRQL